MESTIKCGKHLAEHAELTRSRFHDVCLGNAEFDDVNLEPIREPPGRRGQAHFAPRTPQNCASPRRFSDRLLAAAKFENVNLSNARLNNINMSGVEITDVNTSGMKINGILVEEIVHAYQKKRS